MKKCDFHEDLSTRSHLYDFSPYGTKNISTHNSTLFVKLQGMTCYTKPTIRDKTISDTQSILKSLNEQINLLISHDLILRGCFISNS